MTLHCEPSISVYKSTILPSTLPSTLARDFNNNTNNNEVIHERKSIQSLIDSSKEPPYTRIDTILTKSIPEEYGEGFYGMEVGDVPYWPTLLRKVDLNAVDKNSKSCAANQSSESAESSKYFGLWRWAVSPLWKARNILGQTPNIQDVGSDRSGDNLQKSKSNLASPLEKRLMLHSWYTDWFIFMRLSM